MNSLLKRAGIIAALALATSLAAAEPVTPTTEPLSFKTSWQLTETGPFSQTYRFTLETGALFFGSLTATTGTLGNLSIASLTLSNGTNSYLWNTLGDGHDFDAIASTTTRKPGRLASTLFVDTYSWDSVFLAAGDWTVTIAGNDVDNKAGGQLDLLLVDPPASVPEPASLALAGVALAGAAFAGRRRIRRS